ncbi:hypothetical protein LCGC14_2368750 [marine sediment metagenome]|uniref:Uncharacterized protein n=1 Tax=marine sediment metagenome TaxID=412755 RepID=A0A0F9CRK8_9ZZZZ
MVNKEKCKHAYHEESTNEKGNEICLYCEKERTENERAIKEMFKRTDEVKF